MQVARKDKIPQLAYKFRKFFILLYQINLNMIANKFVCIKSPKKKKELSVQKISRKLAPNLPTEKRLACRESNRYIMYYFTKNNLEVNVCYKDVYGEAVDVILFSPSFSHRIVVSYFTIFFCF